MTVVVGAVVVAVVVGVVSGVVSVEEQVLLIGVKGVEAAPVSWCCL